MRQYPNGIAKRRNLGGTRRRRAPIPERRAGKCDNRGSSIACESGRRLAPLRIRHAAVAPVTPMKDNNIYSMTGYASVTRDIAHADGAAGASVSVELRTVNSRFLDLAFRMPEEARACEPVLRESLTAKLSRGKVDIRINVQRPESGTSCALTLDAVKHLADLEQQVLKLFPDAERMRTGEILRWPGVLGEESVTAEALRDAVIDAGRAAIGSFSDALATIPAVTRGATAISAALARAGLAPAEIDDVILGHVLTAGLGQNPARQAALAAGLETEMAADGEIAVVGLGEPPDPDVLVVADRAGQRRAGPAGLPGAFQVAVVVGDDGRPAR